MASITYDPFRGEGALRVEGSGGGKAAIPAPLDLKFIESIYNPYRRGSYETVDIGSVMEVYTPYGTNDDYGFDIRLKNVFEEDAEFYTVPVDIYNIEETSSRGQGAFQRSTKELTMELIEAPIFREMTKRPIRRVFRDMSAAEIMEEILLEVIGVPDVEIVGDINPKLDSVICPYWNFMQLYEYLKFRVEGGPLLVFPVSESAGVTYKIITLEELMSGRLGEGSQKVRTYNKYSDGEEFTIMRQDYTVAGPAPDIRLGSLQGETVISFDYFSGGLDGEERADYGQDTIPESEVESAQYSYENGVEEYKNPDDRYNKSVVGGAYEKGMELFQGGGILGRYSFLKKEEESLPDHKITIDIDSRKEVEAKLKSRFLWDAHDMITIEASVVPHSNVILGGRYTLELETSLDTDGKTFKKNELLSGKWILTQIVHTINRTKIHQLEYLYVCTFVRAALEANNSAGTLEEI